MRYINEIGAPDALTTLRANDYCGLVQDRAGNWYGVRIAVDQQELDPAPPSDLVNWPRSWTSKNAWAPPTRTDSWANSRT